MSIGRIAVLVHDTQPRDAAAGIFHYVIKNISADELSCSLPGTAPLINARRLGATSTLKLVFTTPSAPSYVALRYTRYKLHLFLLRLLQCNRCYQLGHIISGHYKACSNCRKHVNFSGGLRFDRYYCLFGHFFGVFWSNNKLYCTVLSCIFQ